MKRWLLTAGNMLLVVGLVFLSVWAFKQVLFLENRPGDINHEAILFYRVIQYGALGLIVGVLGGVGYFYRKERIDLEFGRQTAGLVKSRVMGWKAWVVILVVLGSVFGGAVNFLSGDYYFKDPPLVFKFRDPAGKVVFEGTVEEFKNFRAEKKASQRPPSTQQSF